MAVVAGSGCVGVFGCCGSVIVDAVDDADDMMVVEAGDTAGGVTLIVVVVEVEGV